MKYSFLLAISMLFGTGISAQNTDSIAFQKKYKYFKSQVAASDAQVELGWLDSLLTLVENNPEYAYDSIAKVAVRKAIVLDSFELAAKHANLLIGYYNGYLGQPARSVEFYDDIAANLSGNLSPKTETQFLINMGDAYDFSDRDDEALVMYDRAISVAQAHKLENKEALATFYKGYIYTDNGQFATAAELYKKADVVFKKTKDTLSMIAVKNELAILYSKNSFYKEAAQAREEGMAIARAINSKDQMISFGYNASIDFRKQDRYEEEIESLLSAFEISKETGRAQYYENIFVSSLVSAYSRIGNIPEASKYLKILESNPDNTSGTKRKPYLAAKKEYVFAKKEYVKVLPLAEEHLNLLLKDRGVEGIEEGESFLSKVYDQLGRTEKAYEHYKNSAKIRDSINGIQNVKALTYYQTLYETEKQNAQIAAQRLDIAILDAANRQKLILLIAGGIGLLIVFGVISLLRSRNFAKRRRQEQEEFSQALLRTQEEERKRIAQDLHDSVGGSLALAKNKLQGLSQEAVVDPKMEEMVKILDTTGEQVRQISHNILPGELVKFGLVPAVNDMVETMNSEAMEVHFFAHKMEERIDAEKEVHLFRVLQEVLHNALKHAKAQNIFINLTKHPDFLNLIIEDDGVGYDTKSEASGIGIKNMKNRIAFLRGSLQVHSAVGKGTSTTISIPI